MGREKLLSVSDLAHELNMGKAMIQFILKRFKKWLPCELVNARPLYPASILKTIILINENLEMGLLPGDVESLLDNTENEPAKEQPDTRPEDIRISNDGLILLKSFFSEIGEHQARIAAAHEKRAAAEERKAVAIEKRAEAEEKKARAMDHIASALQQMNELRSSVSHDETRQLIHNAADILSENHADAGLDDDETSSDTDRAEDNAEIEMDDLYALVEDKITEPDEAEPLDDLYALIDTDDHDEPTPSDSAMEDEVLDDLSLLIEDDAVQEPENREPEDMDDLSLLIDEPENREKETEKSVEIRIDITPEQDLAKYKAEVMKIIIGLKSDGLSVDKTTELLNANHIKTLSGKPEWSKKAISQIYKFIESAK